MKHKHKNANRVGILISTVGVMLMLIAGAVTLIILHKETENQQEKAEKEQTYRGTENTQGMITGTGTTVIGMQEEENELDFLTTSLYIEEIYVSSGDTIEEGMALLKLSEDSITTAREQLESTATLADLDYRAGKIDYEQGLIDEYESYQLTLLSKNSAQDTYDNTVKRLDDAIKAKEEEITDLQETIAVYEAARADSNYYKNYYNVNSLSEQYEKYQKMYTEKMNYFGFTENQINANGMGASDETTKYNIIAMYVLKQEVSAKQQEYTKAKSECENAESTLNSNYLKAQNDLNSKQLALTELKLSYDESVLRAKSTYNTTLSNVNLAEESYNAAVQKLEDTFEALKDAKEEADENLSTFESRVGDGYLYAEQSGSIMSLNVRASSNLSKGGAILYYSNPETVTVTVAVDQSQIASLSIGGSAYVQISGYGTYNATISEIQTQSSSTGKQSITYDVEVTLSGDLSSLSMNLSATVVFQLAGGQ